MRIAYRLFNHLLNLAVKYGELPQHETNIN